jgi:hypothetical protein
LRLSQFLRWAQLKSFNLKRRWDGGRSEQDEKWLKEFEKLHTPAQGDWRRDPRALAHEIRQAFGDWGYAWSDHAWSTMRPILGNMRTFAGANGFETIVVLLPVRQQIESQVVNDLPQKHFEDLLSDLRLAHLDLFGTLRDDWRMAQQSLFYDHCHLTPRGNRIVATAIFDFLTAQRFVD